MTYSKHSNNSAVGAAQTTHRMARSAWHAAHGTQRMARSHHHDLLTEDAVMAEDLLNQKKDCMAWSVLTCLESLHERRDHWSKR